MAERDLLLIVDDDEKLLEMFKTALESKGYQCETATSAGYALELIGKIPFDMMITDIRMPDIEGFVLTEKAKKLRPNMAVIIMTAYIEEFSYDNAIEAGASDFIKKPFTLKELLARIQHVKLQEKIRAMSVTDELTGLYNRRGFITLAEQGLKQADRLKKGIALIYADLDNLKDINDTLGHQEGDAALIETTKILKETFRQSDLIARIGGDEFVVILLGTTDSETKIAASRLQKALEIYNEKRTRNYNLSMSVGVSFCDPKISSSIDEMLSQADKSLYEQKRHKQ